MALLGSLLAKYSQLLIKLIFEGCQILDQMVNAQLDDGSGGQNGNNYFQEPNSEVPQNGQPAKSPEEAGENSTPPVELAEGASDMNPTNQACEPQQSSSMIYSCQEVGWNGNPRLQYQTFTPGRRRHTPQQPSAFFRPNGSIEWTIKNLDNVMAPVRECNGLFVNPFFSHLQFRSDGSVIDQTGRLYTPLDYVPGTAGPTQSVVASPLSKENLEAMASMVEMPAAGYPNTMLPPPPYMMQQQQQQVLYLEGNDNVQQPGTAYVGAQNYEEFPYIYPQNNPGTSNSLFSFPMVEIQPRGF